MDRFETFRIFVRVAEAQSFTKAATRLGIPRSTVSTAVQELEARVGQRLLHRTTRTVSLTVDGESFLARCSQLLSDLDEAENLFRNGSPLAGKLRVSVPTRIGHLVVTPALPRFLEQNPAVAIELISTDRRLDLIEDDIDCAVRVGEASDNRHVVQMLGELPIVNCASPGYLKERGTPRRPADLSRHTMVGFIPGSGSHSEPWTYRHRGAMQSADLPAIFSTDDAESYIAAAVAGLGLIQVPGYDVRAQLAKRQLVEVLPNARPPSMPLAIVYPKRRHLSRRLQAFIAWLTPLMTSKLSS